MDKLYIDNKEVDMGGNTSISISLRSNLFGDISKIQGNNTSTIKIPATQRNRALIDMAVIPTAITDYPYIRHAGAIERDGVRIVDKANVVILSTSENEIQLSLIWGVSEALRRLLEGDLTLADLALPVPSVTWRNMTDKKGKAIPNTPYVQPYADYGAILDNTPDATYHIAVSTATLLQAIIDRTNNGLQGDTSQYVTLMLPLLQRNADTLTDGGIEFSSTPTYITHNGVTIPKLSFSKASSSATNKFVYTRINPNISVYPPRTFYNELFPIVKGAKLSMQGKVTLKVWLGGDEYDDVELAVCRGKKDVLQSIKWSAKRAITETNYNYEYEYDLSQLKDVVFDSLDGVYDDKEAGDVTTDDTPTFFAFRRDTGFAPFQFVVGTSGASITWSADKIYPYEAEVAKGSIFGADYTSNKQAIGKQEGVLPIALNLPDMKVVDFLKAILQMYGNVAYTDGEGIRFERYETMLDKSRAVDLSKNLVHAENFIPRKQEFKANDEARTNKMLYTDGFSTAGEMDGAYTINNANLPSTRDAIKLPFKKYDCAQVAILPVYSLSADGLEYKSNKDAYACLRVNSPSNGIILTNRGIRWADLLNAYYKRFAEVMNRAKVLTEQFRMSNIEVKQLDVARPIYLQQYGAYFAIIEATGKANNIMEMKLIKI